MIDNNRLVSIIVPVYNAEEYLEECLDSILNQTYSNLEVILINDGSTDKSLNIIESYAEKDSRIVFDTIINSGPGACRNIGLDRFNGDFVMFVDSDDEICVDLIEILLGYISKTSEISMCKFTKNRKKINSGTRQVEKITYEFNDSVKQMYSTGFASSGPYSKLYGREIFDVLRFPDIPMYEDSAISLQVISKASEVKFVDYYGYYYRFNPESITNKKVSERNFAIINKTNIVLEFVEKNHPETVNLVKKICINDNDYVMIECVRNFDETSQKLFNELLQQNRELSKNLGIRKLVYFNRGILIGLLRLLGHFYYNDLIRNTFKRILGV